MEIAKDVIDPFVIACEVTEELIDEVVKSRIPIKDHEKKDDASSNTAVQEKFDFPCSDIRYRTKPKTVIKEKALSVFIFSPDTACISKFINEINKLRRRCIYQRVGDSNQVARLDYVFSDELDQKIFRNKVADLPLPQELVLKMKSVPEELLLHKEAPILSEEELLMICTDSLSENIFHGFSVKILETENVFRFEFESMMSLNLFLARMLNPEKAFLGNLRAMEPKRKLRSIKKYTKRIYPLGVKMNSSNIVDLNELGKKYGFKVFTRKIAVDKLISVDFKSPRDLYKFLTIETNFGFELKTKVKHQSQKPKKGQSESAKASLSQPHVSPVIQQQKPIESKSEGPRGGDRRGLGGDCPSHGEARGKNWRRGQHRGSFDDLGVRGLKRQGSTNDIVRKVKQGGSQGRASVGATIKTVSKVMSLTGTDPVTSGVKQPAHPWSKTMPVSTPKPTSSSIRTSGSLSNVAAKVSNSGATLRKQSGDKTSSVRKTPSPVVVGKPISFRQTKGTKMTKDNSQQMSKKLPYRNISRVPECSAQVVLS